MRRASAVFQVYHSCACRVFLIAHVPAVCGQARARGRARRASSCVQDMAPAPVYARWLCVSFGSEWCTCGAQAERLSPHGGSQKIAHPVICATVRLAQASPGALPVVPASVGCSKEHLALFREQMYCSVTDWFLRGPHIASCCFKEFGIMSTSSANRRRDMQSLFQPPSLMPRPFSLQVSMSFSIAGCRTELKRRRLKGSPCFVPRAILNSPGNCC